MNDFLPIKITDRKYAERILNGEIFMQPLRNFGVLNRKNIMPNNQHFRNDIEEGSSRVYQKNTLEKLPFFKGFEKDFRDVVHSATVIDTGDAQYFKLFCQYALEIDNKTRCFIPPDYRISDFGDSAVIFLDYETFLQRLIKTAAQELSDTGAILLDRVKFYHDYEDRMIDSIFEKKSEYSYQNELRLALGRTDENYRLIRETDILTLEIGSLKDVAIIIPVYELLTLEFLKKPNLKFKLLPGDENSLYSQIAKRTKETMKKYHPGLPLPLLKIL